LKHFAIRFSLLLHFVTPHAGVWIETAEMGNALEPVVVTPHAGVWIETSSFGYIIFMSSVTPHAGVWIETEY